MSKKNVSLFVTVLLTIGIFSMSFLSGSDSGGLSSSISLWVKELLDKVFVNHSITFDQMHVIIRKGAHVFEYVLLGISYYFIAKYWRLSWLKVLIFGVLTAGIDETIQMFVPGRAARWFDVFGFDFGGLVIGLGMMLLLFNRPRHARKTQVILNQIANQTINPKQGYRLIYHQKQEVIPMTYRSHFVRFRIHIPDHPSASRLLKVLLFLPLPLVIVKFVIRFIKQPFDNEISKADLLQCISRKGIQIDIRPSSGERIKIDVI